MTASLSRRALWHIDYDESLYRYSENNKLKRVLQSKVLNERDSFGSECVACNILLEKGVQCHELGWRLRVLRPSGSGSTVGVQVIHEVNEEVG